MTNEMMKVMENNDNINVLADSNEETVFEVLPTTTEDDVETEGSGLGEVVGVATIVGLATYGAYKIGKTLTKKAIDWWDDRKQRKSLDKEDFEVVEVIEENNDCTEESEETCDNVKKVKKPSKGKSTKKTENDDTTTTEE